jgi:hypothetical protein
MKYQIEIQSAIVAMQQVGFLMGLKSPTDVLSKQHIGIHRLLLFAIAAFQVMARCIVVIRYQLFEGIYYQHTKCCSEDGLHMFFRNVFENLQDYMLP